MKNCCFQDRDEDRVLLPLLGIDDAAGGDRCEGGGGEVEAVVRVEGVDGVPWDL